jgi:hypothetical protein
MDLISAALIVDACRSGVKQAMRMALLWPEPD